MTDDDPMLIGDRNRLIMWWILVVSVSLGGLALITGGF
jgi:hypothetical protein